MKTLIRIALALCTVPAAIVVASLFGALHNQVSFTVSPDYFRAFKFFQFGIAPALPERLGAAVVGIRATWWMGLLIGAPVALVGLVHAEPPDQVRATARDVGGALALTATFTLVGLLLGATGVIVLPVDPAAYPGTITDVEAFARAGLMHDASYLGGFLAIFVGPLIVFRERRRARTVDAPSTSA